MRRGVGMSLVARVVVRMRSRSLAVILDER